MKNSLSLLLLIAALGCSTSHRTDRSPVTGERLQELQKNDELLLESLEEGPRKQGSVTKTTEGPMTTEVWLWKEDHGSLEGQTETLLYKNDELISQTLKDPKSGITVSRQYRDGKIFQQSEEWKDRAWVVFFEDGRIKGRMFYGPQKKECILYPEGAGPHFEDMDECERIFNTAP